MEIANKRLFNLPPVRRIYGVEVEGGFKVPQKKQIDDTFIANNLPPGIQILNQYLTNGARYYVDQDHPEYSGPECHTLDEADDHEIAAERFLTHTAEALHLAVDRKEEVRLHKRVTDKINPQNPEAKQHKWGVHYNYSTEQRRFKDDRWQATWAAHVVTSAILFSAGSYDQGEYRVAQKLPLLTAAVGAATQGSIVDVDDEPFADDERWKRLQDSTVDANLSTWAMRMRRATGSIVLRLLEHGVAMNDLSLPAEEEKQLCIAKTVAYDTTLQKLLQVGGRAVTAAQTQRAFLERGKSLAQMIELPEDEHEGLEQWERSLCDLEQNPAIARYIDWIVKGQIIDGVRQKFGYRHRDVRLEYEDLCYDQLYPEGGYALRLRQKGCFPFMPSEQRIARAMVSPPVTTRATSRASLISGLVDLPLQPQEKSVEWGKVQLVYQQLEMELNNPHRTNYPVRAFLQKARASVTEKKG